LDANHIMAIVAEYPEAVVYVRRNVDQELSNHICLWPGEVRAFVAHIATPSVVLRNITKPSFESAQITVREVLADKQRLDGLRDRLEAVVLYDPAPLPDFPDWVWSFDGTQHLNLLIVNGRLVVPPGWEINNGRIGKLEANNGSARIIDGQGRMGLMSDTGEVTVPCTFAYLSRFRNGDHLACEASTETMPARGAPCDLIAAHGRQLNPPGIKIMAGTLWHDRAVVHPDSTEGKGLSGFMTSQGEVLGGRRWKDVREFSERLAAVQDPETTLWGYIDEEGALVIPPGFTRAERFDRDHAIVATPESDGLLGLINRVGNIVAEPVWRKIDWFLGKYFTVIDTQSAIGLIDNRGNAVIEPYYPSREDDAEIDAARGSIFKHPFNRMLGKRLRERTDLAIRDADTLAPLMGMFSPSWAKDIEVRASGLWGRQVTLVADYQTSGHGIRLHAGDTGKIAWYAPVVASIFDLSVEAPVYGFSAMPHASIGVPWELLRFSS
jgi:hypothetical protein